MRTLLFQKSFRMAMMFFCPMRKKFDSSSMLAPPATFTIIRFFSAPMR
jgi:hypothetical protein